MLYHSLVLPGTMMFSTSPLGWAATVAFLATLSSAAHLFGPRLFHVGGGKLGHFGPLGYGHFGDARMGHIGKLHYGQIGGVYGNSFVGAANPYANDALEQQQQQQPYVPFVAEPNPGYLEPQAWYRGEANEAERSWLAQPQQPEMGEMWINQNNQQQPIFNHQQYWENPMARNYQPEYAPEAYWQ